LSLSQVLMRESVESRKWTLVMIFLMVVIDGGCRLVMVVLRRREGVMCVCV
jgi:hypothetical protein